MTRRVDHVPHLRGVVPAGEAERRARDAVGPAGPVDPGRAGGSARLLRGLPAIAPGVKGAIAGSDPADAVGRIDRQRRSSD